MAKTLKDPNKICRDKRLEAKPKSVNREEKTKVDQRISSGRGVARANKA